ncbi:MULTISPECIES: hypothetical protein [unclassified Bradyrhizobium]|uniref:hypothetical protein n=1 Tax=unclassified Bradyrhizobium TaxID=2631580 RepID=UPI0028F09E9F|nr:MULTISPECIES: hypothetical protein [unclassified Bradyrhizobium]
MYELTDPIKTYMERALEETCRVLPNGGDHEVRVFIAQRLADAAQSRRTTLGELGIVARKALADFRGAPRRPV